MPRQSPVQKALETRDGRVTIGMLTSQLNRGFHRAAFLGVAEAAHRLGATLICFEGGVLTPAGSPEAAANTLYDLVGPAAVDGLIIMSSALDWEIGEAGMEAFCRRFAPLPVVSVGRAFPRIPGVLVDNYQGMRAAVTHLIKRHDYRRIAFLRGPEGAREAELRYRAYGDALAEHGIPFAPELVAGPTRWERSDGPAAVQEFLDVRGLRAGADFQAIVSVGDDMACGVLETLQARGIRIPDDVAVVGFNDDDEGRAILPALTTVRQPVDAMARAAVNALLALLDGQAMPETTTLSLDLVVRRSCGCLSPAVIEAAERPARAREGTGARQPLTERMARAIGPGGDAAEMARLADDFLRSAVASDAIGPAVFLATLNDLLQRNALAGQDVNRWHQALSLLRGALLVGLPEAALSATENLLQQARVLIGETASQARAYQRFRAEQDTRLLGDFIQHIQTAADREALLRTLAAELPGLGVSACFLVLYEDPQNPGGAARLVFGYDATGRRSVNPDEAVFPAAQLLPTSFLPAVPKSHIAHHASRSAQPRDRRPLWDAAPGNTTSEPHSLIALPLYFQQHQLGILLLVADARGAAFSEILREQISSALTALSLREDLRRALAEAEAANNLKSRFLATVSHELRTPLSLITGTIEMMLRDEATAALPQAHVQDLDRIGASAQHLSRLIGDVLDLASSQAGELRLVLEPLKLETVLAEAAQLGSVLAREKGLRWHAQIATDLPRVRGDRTRLRQVALNLVSNAIKFTEHGEVTLAAEAMPDGVRVAVSDTGVGIPAHEQAVIFDEFRRSGRTTERGYGGMGLGLAISRRLVELHGGRIGVRSSGVDGGGSTFFFTLPALAAEQCGDAAPQANRSGQVLLLSERPGDDALCAHLLARGFVVEMLDVCDCPDWLDRIVAAPPGAVLLDYAPAAERGWELMRALKLNPATRDVPVIFYALAVAQHAGAILELDYLAKPAGGRALAEAMERQGIHAGECRGERTILVADDDPAMCDLHARMVRAHVPGCTVLTAANGREVLELMAETRPDLVLLDLMMPELDGFDVLEAMREREETRRIPVIVLTAQILTAADMARLQQGVAAVLSKGLFSADEVLSQVESTLARSKRLGVEAQRVARQAMAYIHEHFAEELSREDLARYVAVNERYLTRCFQQEAGISPITYLTRYRIKQAKALLARGNTSVTDVALAVGFSDSGYFSRVFREEVGVSPSAFQRAGAG